jgi:hypothetical protein
MHAQWFHKMFCCIRAIAAYIFFLAGMKADTKYLECWEPTCPAKSIFRLEKWGRAIFAAVSPQTFETHIEYCRTAISFMEDK